MYKTLYKWHKWIGLVISVPVIIWALSGLLHPTLRLTKPVLETHKLKAQPIVAESIGMEADVILQRHGVSQVKNVRLIMMHGKTFYRLNLADGRIEYFDTQSGDRVVDGEQRYAEYLARHYLGDQNAAISSIEAVSQFSEEYAPINRFLPVWRVSFLRDDGLRLYVDTESSRLAASVDNLRAELLWWFGTLHNWSFLDKASQPRIAIFVIAMLMLFVVGLTGLVLYGLRYQWLKKSSCENSRKGAVYFHRTIGLLISLSTLMFSLSGGVHVWHKLSPDVRHTQVIEDLFMLDELGIGIRQAIRATAQQGPVKSVSMLRVDDKAYYRLVHVKGKPAGMKHADHAGDFKKSDKSPAVSYVHSQRGTVLQDAEHLYARQLANRISGFDANQVNAIQTVTRFNSEYGFIERRLPVVQVHYEASGNPAYYVDPATGRLAMRIDDGGRFENFTFRMFHKWRFADGLGKNGRDGVIAVFILLNVLVIILGVMMYLSRRRRNSL